MNDGLITIVASLITGAGSYLLGANTNKTTLRKAQEDNDLEMDKFYAGEMGTIISEYKEQVSGFREELRQVKQEFSDFKKQHEKEVAEYANQISFLQEENDDLKIENAHLKEENEQITAEIIVLRGKE